MILLPNGDPACWGMDGLPLLPPDWRHGVTGIGLEMNVTTTRRSQPESILSLSFTGSWMRPGAIWKAAPASIARDVAQLFVEDPANHRWLDHPVLSAPPRDFAAVPEIPFLQHTRHLLSEKGLLNHDFGWILTSSSALELWQMIDDVTALLDLIITSRNWVHKESTGSAVVADRENVFDLAAERFLAMAGVPIFAAKRNLADTAYRNALAGRSGLTASGKLTLEESGQLLGITRERLRQLAKRYPLDHEFQRAWPASNSIDSLLDNAHEKAAILRVSKEYQLNTSTEERLEELSTNKNSGMLRDIAVACWNLSEGSGFFRIPDAIELLRTQYDFSEDHLRSLIEKSALITDLPHQTAFIQYSRDPWIVETSHIILGHLEIASITKLHLGLVRRHSGRGRKNLAGPPARDILLAFYTKHSDFEVHGDRVTSLHPKQIDDSTVQAWILRQIKQSGGVAHRSTLFELARRDGINRSSLAVFLGVHGYLIAPVGSGCFARLGDPCSPTDISIARSAARTISVPTTGTKWTTDSTGMKFQCVVGTNLLDTGVVSAPKKCWQLIGDQRLLVQSSIGTHGHVALSQNTSLYGLSAAFQALDVAPGDTLELSLNIHNQVAAISISHS